MFDVYPLPLAFPNTDLVSHRNYIQSHLFPNIIFAAQNCNSLNISPDCNKQVIKLLAIISLCTDIIFLSDLRLNENIEKIDKVKSMARLNSNRSYDCYFNSTKKMLWYWHPGCHKSELQYILVCWQCLKLTWAQCWDRGFNCQTVLNLWTQWQ